MIAAIVVGATVIIAALTKNGMGRSGSGAGRSTSIIWGSGSSNSRSKRNVGVAVVGMLPINRSHDSRNDRCRC